MKNKTITGEEGCAVVTETCKERKFLSVNATAELLGVSANSVYKTNPATPRITPRVGKLQ